MAETATAEGAPPAAAAVDAKTRASLLRQLEYYFSDLSYPFDTFLQGHLDESGGVPVSILAGSPRVVSMTPTLATDQREDLMLALAGESDDVVVVGGGKRSLARKWPLPADDPAAERSAYLSGVPKTADEEELRAMLGGCSAAASFAPILAIRRVRDVQRDRAFSGQIFVECESSERAAALVGAANKGKAGVTCTKAKLLRDFFDRQAETIREQKAKRANSGGGGGTSGGTGAVSGTKRALEGGDAVELTEEERAQRDADEAAVLLCFDGVGPTCDREALSAACAPHGKVAWVEYERGASGGTIRFDKAEGCAAALAALGTSPPDLGGASPSWRAPTADESKAYWQAYRSRRAEQKDGQKRQRGGGGKGGGGKGGGKGGGGYRGRGRGGGRR